MNKSYDNKGRNYNDGDKSAILELFHQGYTKKEIAFLEERQIKSIQRILDQQLRNSVIFEDAEANQLNSIFYLLQLLLRHPNSRVSEVIDGYKGFITDKIINCENIINSEQIMNLAKVELQILATNLRLQRNLRNNPQEDESIEVQDFLDKCDSESTLKSAIYLRSIKSLKENIKSLKEYKDRIISKFKITNN